MNNESLWLSFFLFEKEVRRSRLTRRNVSIQISMQRYERHDYVQGQAMGSCRKSPHLWVVFSVETLY